MRRSFTGNLRVAGKLSGVFRWFQSRIEAATYEQASHHPFPESLVARALSHPPDSHLKDFHMRKGFTRKPQGDDPATRDKNYITPSGLQRLKDEHRFLLTRERPAVTEVVAWAASNGDSSATCVCGVSSSSWRSERHAWYVKH